MSFPFLITHFIHFGDTSIEIRKYQPSTLISGEHGCTSVSYIRSEERRVGKECRP